jgi:hypothetical protein
MKRIHPKLSHAAAVAALAVCSCHSGCRTPSSAVTNPFLAPDRVPPPATRAILPGQAQPYYPGDPLPVMQSNASPPASDTGGLAWSAPTAGPAAAAPALAAPRPALAPESLVAVPADNDSLRFALPQAAEPAPITPENPAPMPVAETMPAAGSASQPVVQASYSEPTMQTTEPAPSPWRQPQIASPSLPPPPPVVQRFVPQPASSLAAAPPSMDVRLRAVASPPPEPGDIPSPRIRMPGDAVPQMASHDGFRPRSSMR